jgi:glyoxylase-like metal-dependent hydrolase (beta-lactamase superfamily II)
MKAVVVPVTPFRQNCSVLWCEATMRGAVVDPGGDLDRVLAAVEENGVRLEKVLVTHGHVDHASAVAELAERFGLPIEGPHPDDSFLIEALGRQGARYGFAWARPFTPDRWLRGGDEVRVGELLFEVRHCPGHTPGHIVFFNRAARLALVGDVLFRGSVGRSDLPRGNHEQLIRAIRAELWPLGDDVTFVPGHGPLSTFGHERMSNPYCSDFVEV